MNHSKVIRPTSFPSPLKRRLNSNPPPFSNLKSSDLLRSSHAKLQPLPTFKPQNRSATLCHKPAHFLVPKPCSPSDSGVSSISSHDSNDRTPLTPSGIMPIHDIWSNGKFGSGEFDPAGQTISNHFGSFDEYSSTAGGEHRFLSETDRLVAEIWNAPADQSIKSSFSSLSNSNRSNKPAVAAGRSLLTNLSKLNDLNAAYEFDSKAPVGVDGVDLGATIMNTKQLGAPIEQCEDDCNACWSPNSRKTLADARNSLINEQQLVDDCRRCTDLSHFDRLLDLAEVIYQANYDDVTYNAESAINPATNLPIFIDTKFCRFCKNNKEKREVYLAHTTRNKSGETTCPILMRHICEECGATGAQAHTRSYCPMLKASKSEDLKLAVKLYHGDRKLT